MNYTENYHLPQWVKDDRIMMEDFNQMCADIENGLTETSADAKDLRQSSGVQQKRTLDCLHRLAYNHFCAVQDMEPLPNQIGVFYQNFEKDLSGLTGYSLLNGKPFAEKSSVIPTQENVLQTYQIIQPMRVVKDNLTACTPMKATFVAPRTGPIGNYYFQGNFLNYTPNTRFNVRIKLINQDTGGVEKDTVLTFYHRNDNGGFSYSADEALFFLGGVNYMLTMEPLDAVCDMEAQLAPIAVLGYSTNAGIAEARAIVREPAGGRGGMAILRCITGGKGGELKFQWDGVVRQPSITRIAKMKDGWAYHEFIYLREDDIAEESTMSFRFECAQEGCILLHDWGMVIL